MKFKTTFSYTVHTLCAFLLLSFTVNSQLFTYLSNPTVTVTLKNPPILGIKFDKVVFNDKNNNCTNQVVDLVISDFINQGVEVVDRSNLDRILTEHKLSTSVLGDSETISKIGKIIGPSALVTINVLRCSSRTNDNLYENVKVKDKQTGQYYTRKRYISRTEFFLKASVKVTDLTTGRQIATKFFEYNPKRENKSFQGRVEAPASYLVEDDGYKSLSRDIFRLFFHWTEAKVLVYYDNKKGGLKDAYALLKKGDLDGAYKKSKQNLDECISIGEKKKILSRAYYNMGMSYYINREYDKSIEMFTQSKELVNNNIVKNALSLSREAKKLYILSEEFEKSEVYGQEEREKQIEERNKNLLKNEDVLGLVNKKLPENLIIKKIQTSECEFNTSTDALLKLVEAGVSESIIGAMMEK